MVRKLFCCLYMTAILLMSCRSSVFPGESTPQSQFLHNAAHVPAYAFLTFLLVWAWPKLSVFYLVISAFLFGILNEVIQSCVPGRTASVSDVGLNTIGVIVALIFVYFRKGRAKV